MTEGTPSAGKRNASLAGFITGLFLLFVAETLVGLLLERRYAPVPSLAHPDVVAIQTSDAGVLRGFHYWASAVLISGSLLATGWMLFTRWFNGGHTRIWFATCLLFVTSLLSQISGNLLPFDHHGVRTAVVESGVVRRTPIVGQPAARLVLAGDSFNDATLGRWHDGHIAFVVLGAIALAMFVPAIRGEQKSKALSLVPAAGAIILALAVAAPLGHAAVSADYGSYEAQVSWYTWPLHGSLNLWSRVAPGLGWIGSAAIPGLFALFVLALPLLSKRFAPRAVQLAFGGFVVYFLVAGLGFGGRFAPLTGTRDPVQAQNVQSTGNTDPGDPTLIAQGRQIFNTNACVGCHGTDGKNGSSGPDLSQVAARRGTDPTWYVKFIRDPQTVNPTSMMPPFHELTDTQRRAIAEFLIHHPR